VAPEGGGTLTSKGAAYVKGGYVWPIPAGVTAPNPPTSPALNVLKLVVGYIHLFTAVLWLGTILYVHLMVRPQFLTTGLPKAERKLGWISIAIMGISGVILTTLRYANTGTIFAGTWGKVFLIKLAQYVLLVAMAAVATFVLDRRMKAPKTAPPSAAGEGMTVAALAGFDGKEGRKALVAVDGKVYDVTGNRLWKEGQHMRKHLAGQDLTEELKAAPHGAEVMERVTAAGTLAAGSTAAAEDGQGPRAHRTFVRVAHLNLLLVLGILLCVA